MTQALDGTVALVTVASSGIGAAAARALAATGAKVAVPARRKDRLDALAREIDGLAIEADITDREQSIGAVERTADAIVYIVTRPRHVAINEILVRPTEQVR